MEAERECGLLYCVASAEEVRASVSDATERDREWSRSVATIKAQHLKNAMQCSTTCTSSCKVYYSLV